MKLAVRQERHGKITMNISTKLAPVSAGRGALIDNNPRDEYVCWSRMQAEAGQPLAAIVARKEIERQIGDGLFMWGVGNAPAVITNVLARMQVPVRVVFSIMKSRPKSVDISPSLTVAWRRYIDANGIERELPKSCLVTSRGSSASGLKKSHYALMCHSELPLEIRHGEAFDPDSFRNASVAGAAVGSSQVTALLKRVKSETGATDYEANISAWLTHSYWVRLTDPVVLSNEKLFLLKQLANPDPTQWLHILKEIRRGSSASPEQGTNHTLL